MAPRGKARGRAGAKSRAVSTRGRSKSRARSTRSKAKSRAASTRGKSRARSTRSKAKSRSTSRGRRSSVKSRASKSRRSSRAGKSRRMSRKARRQAGKPKRPRTAYVFFVKWCWENQKKKHPNEKLDRSAFVKFSKDCGDMWRNMSDSQKKPYQEQALQDKKRNASEMASYKTKVADGKKTMPKRPLSAYFQFCAQERPKVRQEMPKASVTEIAKELGRRWAKCSESQRAPFVQKAEQDRARYAAETGKTGKTSKPGSGSKTKKGSRSGAKPASAKSSQLQQSPSAEQSTSPSASASSSSQPSK